MNRIILIGNGFDLAHGLKTSYADFILWYYEKRIKELMSSDMNESKDLLCVFRKRNDSNSILKQIQNLRQQGEQTEEIDRIIKKIINSGLAKPENPFFKNIFDTLSNKGWVDIENVYYRFLFPYNEVRNSFNQHRFHYEKSSKTLNTELELLRSFLIEYLKTVQENCISNTIVNHNIIEKMYASFKPKDISNGAKSEWNKFVNERYTFDSTIRWDNVSDWDELLEAFDVKDKRKCKQEIKQFTESRRLLIEPMEPESYLKNEFPEQFLLPNRILILNFNYTNTADLYLRKNERFVVNHIHGNLNDPDSVIFGYGDELDENYKRMSDKNENELLRNIKSIKYLEASNYRNLLEFIESDCFQIFIMGHSCGNSDRTLLNTLFEHKNCVSIKPFYHVFGDGRDNYMELVQNISRNFTDKQLMRDRVVNKTFCDTI